MGTLALVDDDLAAGRLVRLFPEIVLHGEGYHMLYRSSADTNPALKTFITWLKQMGQASSFDPQQTWPADFPGEY